MTYSAIFLSLVADERFRTACDVWDANLSVGRSDDDAVNRFRDVRERLGDMAAALHVLDELGVAS